MSKQKSEYGVFKIAGENYALRQGGFKNSYACEQWIKSQVKTGVDMSGNFAIMSIRRRFQLETKTTVSVKLVDSDATPKSAKSVE